MQTDVLIIGCGIAGASAALNLAKDHQREITILTRSSSAIESNSNYAQGGIVGCGFHDTAESIFNDIIRAGAGLSNRESAWILAEEGPKLLQEILIEQIGLRFDHDDQGDLVFGLEAAHSNRRILHIGDATGNAIMSALLSKIAELSNISLFTDQTVIDLITFPHHSLDPLDIYKPVTCHGAYILNQLTGNVEPVLAQQTILATGGLGQIYLNTTNPPGSRGDGLAMAYRAGARVINAEYVQFHPTALALPGFTKFLISEAVRGEGGILLTPGGHPFMDRYSPEWRDLAPRDIVARSIYWEMLENGYPYVLLDIASHKSPAYIRQRFPHIYTHCLAHNIDITNQPIPVVPAAHYFCGGVLVDLWGKTTLENLYAIGEVSCTGVHGANRLASTSLLEGLVWGARAAQDIRSKLLSEPIQNLHVPAWDDSGLIYDADPSLIQGDMQTIRNLMWHYVGLVRNEYRLTRAIRELRHLWLDIEEFYRKTRLSDNLLGLRNAVQAALIVAYASHSNRSSIGCHYREDCRAQTKTAIPPSDHYLNLSGVINK
jgi:L-aspartate oxidase